MICRGSGHGVADLREQLDADSPLQEKRQAPRTGGQGWEYMGALALVLPDRNSSTTSFLSGAGERVGYPGRHVAVETPDDDASLFSCRRRA